MGSAGFSLASTILINLMLATSFFYSDLPGLGYHSLGLLHLHKTSFVVASQPTGALLGVFSLSAICNLQGLDFFVLRFFFLSTLTLTTENFDGNFFFPPLSPSVEETRALRMHVRHSS